MLYTILQQGRSMSFWELLLFLFSYAVLIFVMLPVHELAHAWVATRLGDSTPRWQGRLTLNPLKHLDVWGTVMLVLFGFGFARPVSVNPRNFAHPRRDMALTALAGPVSNVLMAAASLLLFRIITLFTANTTVVLIAGIVLVDVFASVNLGLAVFNLLPVPPLDGYRVFSFLLPTRWVYWMEQYTQYITIGVLLLVATGALDIPLRFLRRLLGGLLCALFRLPNYF